MMFMSSKMTGIATIARRFAVCAIIGFLALTSFDEIGQLPRAAADSLSRQVDGSTERHGIAMHGEPALPEGFTHFPFVNPDAPRGGRLTLGLHGTFDSLNTYIVRGVAPRCGAEFRTRAADGALSGRAFHALPAACRIRGAADDRSSITFRINPAARFADGVPVTAHDVAFSF